MGHKETRGYYNDTREFNYWTSVKQHEENVEELKIKVDNFNIEKDYQDAQNVKSYQHAVDQQNFRFEQEWRQFERSNQIADEQINYNRKSADFAKRSLDNATYERYLKLQFESAGALLKHRVAQQKTRQQERELLQGHQLTTAKAAITAQENLVKTLKKTGTATVKGGRGRSLQKEVGQWWGVAGREQAAMLSMINSANEQVATKLYGLAYTAGVHLQKRALTVKAEKQTRNSIMRAYKLGTEEILMKWEGADMQANHKRLLEPVKGPAPIKPTALPRLEMGDSAWKNTFDTHGGVLSEADVKSLGVFQPSEPGLDKDFRRRHKIKGKDFRESPGDLWTKGPVFDYEKEGGGAVGFGGTGARAGSVSVGSVTSAVGAGMMAASAIGAAATAGTSIAATGGMIGLGGLGSVGLSMMGPIGMGIAAIGFIGSIFDWW